MRIAFVVNLLKFEELLGIGYLSAIAKKRAHEVRLFEVHKHNFVKEIASFSPEIIAYSVITGTEKFYLEINRKLKERLSFLSLWGGPHPTFFPQIIEEDGVDAVCIGEGEQVFEELLEKKENRNPILDIKNLWIKQDDSVKQNELRDLIDDLDQLPFPDRVIFFEASPILTRQRMRRVISTRGCPFHCTYCFNELFFTLYRGKGRRVRRRSVGNVMQEIEQLRSKYPLDMLQFIDDTFNMNKEWLREFADAYSSRIGLPFQCNVRPDLMDEEIADSLLRAGCAFVTMGIEAGNDKLRNEVLKRGMTRKQIITAARLLKERGIKLKTENILGIPGGGLRDDLDTLHLNIEIKADIAMATLFQPYPSTALAEYAVKEGFFDGDYSNIGHNYFFASCLKFSTRSEKRKVVNLQSFFGLITRWPHLLKWVNFLLPLPPNPIFRWITRLNDAYGLGRIMPIQYSFRDKMRFGFRFLARYYK